MPRACPADRSISNYRGLAAGMDDYQSKPIRPRELFDAIERNAKPVGTAPIRQPTTSQSAAFVET